MNERDLVACDGLENFNTSEPVVSLLQKVMYKYPLTSQSIGYKVSILSLLALTF